MTYPRSETSTRAYQSAIASGLIPRARQKVYTHVFLNGPKHRNQLDAELAPGVPNPPYSRRIKELADMGLFVAVGELDGLTLWDCTENTPVRLPKKKPGPRAVLKVLEDVLAGPGFPDARLNVALSIVREARGEARAHG